MSTFKNISGGELTIQDAEGRNKTLAKDETFSGSNFYKRFVASTLLKLVTDDGGVYPTGSIAEGAGAVVRPVALTAGIASAMEDNEIDVEALIGGPAKYVDITTDGAVTVRINGDEDSDFAMAADETRRFDNGDILISMINVANAGIAAVEITGVAVGVPA